MLDLIKKDFRSSWMFQIAAAHLIFFISSLAISALLDDFRSAFVGIFTLITIILCILPSFIFIAVDTTFNADMIYASLPVKRSKIVLSIYITSFIQMLTSLFLVILTILFSYYVFNNYDPAFDKMLSAGGIIGMAILLSMILSFILPFIFKFGSGKGFYTALIVQIVLMLLFPLGEFILNVLEGIITFDITLAIKMAKEVIQWMMTFPKIYAYLSLLSFVSCIISISIVLSVRFYNKKDL